MTDVHVNGRALTFSALGRDQLIAEIKRLRSVIQQQEELIARQQIDLHAAGQNLLAVKRENERLDREISRALTLIDNLLHDAGATPDATAEKDGSGQPTLEGP